MARICIYSTSEYIYWAINGLFTSPLFSRLNVATTDSKLWQSACRVMGEGEVGEGIAQGEGGVGEGGVGER